MTDRHPNYSIIYKKYHQSSFPLLPLLRYCTQLRRKPPPPPPPAISIATSFNHHTRLLYHHRRRKRLPAAAAAFLAALHQRGAGFDGQCGHLLRLEPASQPTQREREVKLAELELLVVAHGRHDVVEVHFVGVTNEAGRVLL